MVALLLSLLLPLTLLSLVLPPLRLLSL